jgi:protein SCO1/2
MKNKFLFLGLGIAALTLAAAAVWMLTQPYTFRGSLIDPPVRAADFVLTAQDDHPFRLSDQAGQVVVIFFGYTSCPDVCPTTMMDFKRIRAQLESDAERVRFVFITVDPERDTVEKQKTYISAFDPSFIGLTGTMTELENVWKNYGVFRYKRAGTSDNYLMDHTARIYVVDARGNLRVTFAPGMSVAQMAADIQHLVGEARAQSLGAPTENGASNLGDLRLTGAWARPMPSGGTTAVYLKITNTGAQSDALIGAQSAIAQFGEIHETRVEGGIMRMQPAARVEVKPGQSVEFKPGGYHIMLVGLTRDAMVGQRIPVTLQFERAGRVTFDIPVVSQ